MTPPRGKRDASAARNRRSRDPRHATALALGQVLHDGVRLDVAIEQLRADLDDARDTAFTRELLSGTVRWHLRLRFVLERLLSRPLKDRKLELPLLLGLYQLGYTRVAPHAAVSSSVELARKLGLRSASGLVNGVLRRFQREGSALLQAADADPVARYAHPLWLIEALRAAYPANWRQILDANNQRAPLTLRVNATRTSREAYLQTLASAGINGSALQATTHGITLEGSHDPRTLPGFTEGLVSVQDGAAQLASELLDAPAGASVLDACAAPGGKTAAILERAPGVHMTATDLDGARQARTRDSLARLGLHARLEVMDATTPRGWDAGTRYSHILADVPCSATGIIRRHPDVKLRRQPDDVQHFARTQQRILETLWPLVAPGGTLLYATCSLLPAENVDIVSMFAAKHADAVDTTPAVADALPLASGIALLPGVHDMDGFYYARLTRS